MAKVLLAEDDPTMVSLLKVLLKMEGFDVVALSSDANVPDSVVSEKPDVLFMDVHIGQQNGMDIMKLIRKNPETSGLRVVMTSGLNVKDECLRCGANHFLLKPFMPDDLISVLKQ
ncbi:MAG: response regulator [Anaerolineales bacterium]